MNKFVLDTDNFVFKLWVEGMRGRMHWGVDEWGLWGESERGGDFGGALKENGVGKGVV